MKKVKRKKSRIKRTRKEVDLFYNPLDFKIFNKKQWKKIGRDFHLTLRERQVAKLVCRAWSDAKIAKELKIAKGTVKVYIRYIYAKARVKNKVQLVLRFAEIFLVKRSKKKK